MITSDFRRFIMKLNRKELIKLISLISVFLFTLVAFILFAAPFVSGKVLGTSGTGFDLALNFDSGRNAGLFIAWLIALLLMVGMFVGSGFFFLTKAKVFKNNPFGFGGRIALGFAAFVFALYVTSAILIFCTIPMFGIGNLYGLGGGAIASGILLILAGCTYCCGTAYYLLGK